MLKCLIIGSVTADVIVRVPRLPSAGEDIHIDSQTLSLGGCAWNVFHILRLFHVPAVLFSPVGTGIYGEFVRNSLRAKNAATPIPPVPEPNGCCYCFVEQNGERTFLSDHGAEYRFRGEWFRLLEGQDFDLCYICGLEIEEPAGACIIDYLESIARTPFVFAPGPRILRISPDRLDRLFALHPILHLNRQEALSFTGADSDEKAAQLLFERTGNPVIITLGREGAYCCSEKLRCHFEPVPQKNVLDTTGAGDSHAGTVMACLSLGFSLPDAIQTANHVASAVTGVSGTTLSEEEFKALPFPMLPASYL